MVSPQCKQISQHQQMLKPMAKHNKYAEKEKVTPVEETQESVAQPVEVVKVSCPDCTVLVADGGKSEFSGKGGSKAGLINENTHCPNCNGRGVV